MEDHVPTNHSRANCLQESSDGTNDGEEANGGLASGTSELRGGGLGSAGDSTSASGVASSGRDVGNSAVGAGVVRSGDTGSVSRGSVLSLRDGRSLSVSGLGGNRVLSAGGVDVGSSVLRDAEGGAGGDGVGAGTIGDGGGLRADVAGGVDNLGGGVGRLGGLVDGSSGAGLVGGLGSLVRSGRGLSGVGRVLSSGGGSLVGGSRGDLVGRGRRRLGGVGRVLSGSRGRDRGSRVSLVLGSSKGNGGEASNNGEGTHLDGWFEGWY